MLDYTDRPNRLRVYVDDYDGSWTIDGADDAGDYTEAVWSGYPTLAAALEAAPEFVRATQEAGVKWEWRTARRRGLKLPHQYPA